MRLCLCWRFCMFFCAVSVLDLHANGSGLNVLVVVNPNSPNSVELGNYYCERRHVPPQNVVRLRNWTGGNVGWTRAQFQSSLLDPVLEQCSARRLDRQIDFVLLSMDIPYRITEAGSVNTTTAVLFYGFKPDTAPPGAGLASCTLPPASSNSYAFSEGIFRDSPPGTAPTNAFLAMMLTASSVAQAKFVVDQGVACDGTFPAQTAYLAKTTDTTRTVRYVLFDDAIFDTRILGNYSLVRTDEDSPYGLTGLLGYQTGLYQFNILSNAFVPGAMADNLTSFGGMIFVPNDQTTVLAFLNAGASGTYGTVVEPCPDLEKFPSPRDYFYQARGFSLAECYYMSLRNPYQGLLVGEPLAAPFARRANGSWSNLPPGALLSGTTNLALQFTASDPSRPLQQVDLFLDGTFVQTLTNTPPAAGNLLSVTVNGYTANYVVPMNATLRSISAGLADTINVASNASHVIAFAAGDRIALRLTDPGITGDLTPVTASAFPGFASASTAFVTASRSTFLDSVAFASCSLVLTNAPLLGDWLQLDVVKTNGLRVTLSATNTVANNALGPLIQSLMDQVNSNADLQTPDGVAAEDFAPNSSGQWQFTLRARVPGLGPSQVQAILSGSPTILSHPGATNHLDANLSDVQPRNHLFLTVGVTNLAFSFPLDTTALADGHHAITAIAYEGSHVRTRTPVAQMVLISNTPLSAAFAILVGDTNSALEATLVFLVTASTNSVASLELFSTGGSLGVVSNQAGATFSVAATNLGVGLHPFYAVVAASSGAQYRTETKWIRLVGTESPFSLAIAGTPPLLSWPAVAGRRYDILSADSVTNGFQLRETVLPANAAGQWIDGGPIVSNRFYRVHSAR